MSKLKMFEILNSAIYPFLLYFVVALFLAFVNDAARERVKINDNESYKKIVSERSLFFEQGGVSPADIGSYFRFYMYLMKRSAKSVIGTKMWYFYRVFVPLEFIAISWLIILGVIFIGNA